MDQITGETAVREFLLARVGPDALARARRRLHIKALSVVVGFVLGYGLIVVGSLTNRYVVISGVVLAGLCGYLGITSVMHDANHGAMFASKRLNSIVGYWVDVLGGSSMLWCFKHNDVHHEHANINSVDPDIQQSPFLRLNHFQKWRPWYRFQHIYAPLLYGFMTLQVAAADVLNLARRQIRGHKISPPPTARDFVAFIAGKLIYATWAFVVPFLLFGLTGLVVSIGVTWCVGLALALTVQVAHAVSEVDHLNEPSDLDSLGDAVDVVSAFVRHQASVSADVETNGPVFGRLVRFFAGGLDRQVAHHLVPSLPHTLYPELTPHIAELCAANNVEHRTFPTVGSALAAHFRWLRELGVRPA